MGLVQALGGAVEIVIGGVGCSGGVTCVAGTVVATQGFDNLHAGSNTLVTGKLTKIEGVELLETLGVSPEYSELVYSRVGTIGVTRLVLKSTKIGELISVGIGKMDK